MANFKISLQKTLTHEGGYVNDPDDLGKETYKGISRPNHKNWQGWPIVDNYKNKPDFPASLEKNMELQKQVELFYLYEFWLPIKGDLIANQTNADSIFDFAVNAGVKISVQLAQSIIGTTADGIVGEQTLKKLNSFEFGYFQPAFTVSKITHYIAIIKKRPIYKKYLYGWIIRALEYLR
ncbi:MAG: N-acetylmuramidase [Bacteroidetes bacterium]|nr:N-acetylmuramidase [Bacteroidota bacterium]